MGIDKKSKLFANCIKNLYEKNKYTVEYAIMQLEKYKDSGKIIASDYEEYLAYFVSEMDKENIVEEIETNKVEQEETEVIDEIVNNAVDEIIESKEVEENV